MGVDDSVVDESEEQTMDEQSASPEPVAAKPAVTPPHERPWYLRPNVAIWLGPVLIVACLAMRFGWNGLEGPPFPFWGVAYALGAAGIFLVVTAWMERQAAR
jgi:hypothetical protein